MGNDSASDLFENWLSSFDVILTLLANKS